MFSTLPKTNFNFWATIVLSSANPFNLDKSKILYCKVKLSSRQESLEQYYSKLVIIIIGQCRSKIRLYLRCSLILIHTDRKFPWIALSMFTLCQKTNCRLYQSQTVCRRQFQIRWKWRKVLLKVRKHCGKRRSCLYRAISPFLTVLSKDLYSRHVKTRACLREDLRD